MFHPVRSVTTALRIVKLRLPRTPASVFAVMLLVPLVGDELPALATPSAAVGDRSSPVPLPSASDAAQWLVEGDTYQAAPSLTPAPSPIAVIAAPEPAPVRVMPAPTRAVLPPSRATPTASAPTAPPQVAQACPADWICYARLGVSGRIVPYTDCSGGSDVGTAIRAFTCLSPTYLLGHAHTQFGKITQWRAGDVVYAYGRPYTVTGATTQSSCAQPLLPLAPLSLQTSLSPNACGLVLVVQAR